MTHPRQIMREAVSARLAESLQNVFTSRAKPLFDQDLPAVLVYAGGEQIKRERWDTDGQGPLWRDLEILVECVDMGKDDLDNRLDALAESVESALDGWDIPGYKNAVMRFTGTDMDMSIEGNKTYGAIRLAFTLTYITGTKNNAD